MIDLSNSLPDQLPGIQIAFGLKQCLGDPDLLLSLLDKLWEDYSKVIALFRGAEPSTRKRELLHDIRGAAINLGLSTLGDLCLELREQLKQSGELTDELVQRFQLELEIIGSSIKTLDSLHQS